LDAAFGPILIAPRVTRRAVSSQGRWEKQTFDPVERLADVSIANPLAYPRLRGGTAD